MCQEEDTGPALFGKTKPFILRQVVIRSNMEWKSIRRDRFQDGVRVGGLGIDLGKQKLRLDFSKAFKNFGHDRLQTYRDELYCPQ